MAIDRDCIRSVLEAAEAALVSLGACDDPECDRCGRALPQVRAALEELREEPRYGPRAIRIDPSEHYTIGCPTCGGDLAVLFVLTHGGDPRLGLACAKGHEWSLIIDMWRQSGVRLFLTRPGDHGQAR